MRVRFPSPAPRHPLHVTRSTSPLQIDCTECGCSLATGSSQSGRQTGETHRQFVVLCWAETRAGRSPAAKMPECVSGRRGAPTTRTGLVKVTGRSTASVAGQVSTEVSRGAHRLIQARVGGVDAGPVPLRSPGRESDLLGPGPIGRGLDGVEGHLGRRRGSLPSPHRRPAAVLHLRHRPSGRRADGAGRCHTGHADPQPDHGPDIERVRSAWPGLAADAACGWTYRVRTPTSPPVVAATDHPAQVLRDNPEDSYSLEASA